MLMDSFEVEKNPHAPDFLLVALQTTEDSEPISFELRRSLRENDMEVYPRDEASKLYLQQGPAFIGGPRNLTKFLTTRSNFYWLNDELAGIKVNKPEGRVPDVLRSIDVRIEKIELRPSGQIYLDLGQRFRTLLPINLVGEGIQRLLSIIMDCYDAYESCLRQFLDADGKPCYDAPSKKRRVYDYVNVMPLSKEEWGRHHEKGGRKIFENPAL